MSSKAAAVMVFLLSSILLLQVLSQSRCTIPPVIFNFGDSNSDTGGLVAGLGFPVNLPNGRNFFASSTGRFCDGRLIIDFFCESLNSSRQQLLSPYLDSIRGHTYENGVNFAVAGSKTLPKYTPFALNIQLMQFIHFKSLSLQLSSPGHLINEEGFKNALYMIDIGQNDLADSFANNLTYAQVIRTIPSIITEIKNAIKAIHDQGGGRKFWVHNTGPFGCLPKPLTLAKSKTSNDLDSYGCLTSYNAAARIFNAALLHLCGELRSELSDSTIVYVDIYSIKFDLIANSSRYGFASPLMACCGSGGPPYNYDLRVGCGLYGYEVCTTKYVNWDGVHYTEAANFFVAAKVLSMNYSTPRVPFDFFCR
ncbi:GDSL esterase/lipase At1g09390-like [Impatiens glandulifera]|uniref:GDSL esterase/lipase At1g09390-like n=1 Tax=Impatiens glandulifera TaxID=253017 RepID=UPI001FB10C2C|nr:GDSL esterase/lipase At1g09390-like [Impatiens glandulifera]